jgi:hypothetical protein
MKSRGMAVCFQKMKLGEGKSTRRGSEQGSTYLIASKGGKHWMNCSIHQTPSRRPRLQSAAPPSSKDEISETEQSDDEMTGEATEMKFLLPNPTFVKGHAAKL